MSQAQAQKFVNSFMNKLAGDGVKLSPSLQGVFAKILANQVTVDSGTNLVTFASAFETLSKVFTFIATPAGDRPPTGPLDYSATKVKEAKQAAAVEVDLKVDGLPSTPNLELPKVDGKTFELTQDVDNLVATDKNDLFKATVGNANTPTTLNKLDKLDGSAGNDTLQVNMYTSFNGFDTATSIKNIENVVLTNQAAAAATFNAKGMTGVNQYILNAKKAALALNGLNKAGIKVQVNDQASGELAISFDAAAVAGANDALTLNLHNVGRGVDTQAVKVKVGGIENLAVNAAGTNWVDLSGATEAKKITLKNADAGTLNVTNIGAAVTTFDASAATNAVHLDLSAINAIGTTAKLTTLTTGKGNDVVTLDLTKLAANAKLDGGLGNNTLKLSGIADTTLGMAKEQSVKNFQALELSGKGIKTLGTAVTDVKTLVLNDQTGDVTADFAKASDFTLNAVGANTAKITLNAGGQSAPASVFTYKTIAKTSTNVAQLENSKGEITSGFASKLVIDLGNFTQQSGKINANNATDLVLNVAKNAEFSAAVNALVAKSLTINAEGKLSTKNIVVDYATAVDITAKQGGAVRVVADKAKTVTIVTDAALALTGSSFEEAETVTITANKGDVTGTNVNLTAVKTLKLAGEGSVTLGTIGSGGAEGQKVINLDIVGMKRPFNAGTIKGDSIDIKAASSGTTKIDSIIATAGETINIKVAKSSGDVNTVGEFIITGPIGFLEKDTTPKAKFAKNEGPMLLTEGKDIFKVVLEGDAKFSLGSTVVADIIDVDASGFTGTDTASSFGKMSADTITVKGKGLEANQITIVKGKDILVTGGSKADSLILEQAIGKTDAIKITFNGGAEDSLAFTNANPVDLTNTNSALNLTGVARVKANDLKVKASDITAKPLEIDGKLVIANVVAGTDLSKISAAAKGGVEIETKVGANGELILGGIKNIEDLTIAVKDAVPAGTSVKFDTADLEVVTNLTFKLGANDTSEEVVKLSVDSVFNVPGDLTIQSGQLDVSAVPVGNFSVGTNGEGTILTLNKSGLKLSVEQLLKLSTQEDLVIDADSTANGVQVEITKDTTPAQIAALKEALKENGALEKIFAKDNKIKITVADDVLPENKDAAAAAAVAGDNFVGGAVDPQIAYAEAVAEAKTAAEGALTDLNTLKGAFVALGSIDTLAKATAAKAAAIKLNKAIDDAEQAAIDYVKAAEKTTVATDDVAAAQKSTAIGLATAAATTSLHDGQAAAFDAAFTAAKNAITGIAANTDSDGTMTVAQAKAFISAKINSAQAIVAAEAATALADAIAESILDSTKKLAATGEVAGLIIPAPQELTSIPVIKDTAANLAANTATDIFEYADKIVVTGNATVAQAIAIVQAAAANFVSVLGVDVVDTVTNIQGVTASKDLAVLTLVDSVKFTGGSVLTLNPQQFTAFGSKLENDKAKINGDIIAAADVAAVVENPSKLVDGGITAINLTAAQFATEGLPAKLTAKAATIMNKDLISGSDADVLVQNASKIKAGTIQKIAITAEQFVVAGVIAALGTNAAEIRGGILEGTQTTTVVNNIGKIAKDGITEITLTANQFTALGVIDALKTGAATIKGVIDTAQAAVIVTNVTKIAVGGIQGEITLNANDIFKAKDGLLAKLGDKATVTVISEIDKPLTIADARKIFEKTDKVTFDQIEDKVAGLSDSKNKELVARAEAVTVSDAATVAQVKTILDAATLAMPNSVTIDKITDTANSLTSLAGDSNSASAPYLAALKKAADITAVVSSASDFNKDLKTITSDATTKTAKITASGEFKGDFGDFALVVDNNATLTADVAKLAGLTATGKGNLKITAKDAAINNDDLAKIAVDGTVTVTDVKANVEHSINLGEVVGKAAITGGNKVDTITASKGGSEITGGEGNDVIKLGVGIDTVKFSGTRDSNGVDKITGFTAGARLGDKLDFNDFFFGNGEAALGAKLIGANGVAGTALNNFSAAAKTGKPTDIAGKVVVLQGASGGSDEDTTALQESIIFAGQGGESAKFSLADGEKTVVLSAQGSDFGQATIMNVYYVTGQQGADKMELVGIVNLEGTGAGFVTGNFA